MKSIKFLVGHRFLSLIQDGKEVERLIKKGGQEIIEKSSTEQENKLSFQWYKHSLPNPLPLGILCFLLIIPLVFGYGTTIDYFTLPIILNSILYLCLMPVTGIYIAFIPYTLGRGYASGLYLVLVFYILDILLSLTGFFLMSISPTENNNWMQQLGFFLLQILILYLCRYILNSHHFYKLISFSRTTRLLLEAKKEREKQQC